MDQIPVRRIHQPSEGCSLKENFNIRAVEHLYTEKRILQHVHRHEFFYILALQNGKGEHEIDFTPYQVNDNTIFFMRPGQVHKHTLEANGIGYLIEFMPEFYNTLNPFSSQQLRKASQQNYYHLSDKSFTKISAILHTIFNEFKDKQRDYLEVIKTNLSLLFIELVRQHQHHKQNQISLYKQEKLELFFELLEKHATQHKSVADYANMLNLSVYQLNTIIKSTLGKTCSRLILEHVILEAKKYLLATPNQVNQIAYLLGYEDVSYFIRLFKKHTGYSPEVFRQNFE